MRVDVSAIEADRERAIRFGGCIYGERSLPTINASCAGLSSLSKRQAVCGT